MEDARQKALRLGAKPGMVLTENTNSLTEDAPFSGSSWGDTAEREAWVAQVKRSRRKFTVVSDGVEDGFRTVVFHRKHPNDRCRITFF